MIGFDSKRNPDDEAPCIDGEPAAGGSRFHLARFLILRLLGLVYFTGFAILINQGLPLIGSRGLLPVGAFTARVAERLGALLPLNEPDPLFALALQQGALLKDDDTRGAFSQPAFRRALDFYAGVFRAGLAPSMTSAQISNVWDEFARGMFAFYITGPWNIGEFRRRLPPERQNDWAAAPLPGPDGPGVSTAGGSSLVMFRSSPRKQAASNDTDILNCRHPYRTGRRKAKARARSATSTRRR